MGTICLKDIGGVRKDNHSDDGHTTEFKWSVRQEIIYFRNNRNSKSFKRVAKHDDSPFSTA